jgi:hypothetical protein
MFFIDIMNRSDITRIDDLPSNSGRDPGGRGSLPINGNQYQPLNVHQNPYGIPEPVDNKLPAFDSMGPAGMGMGPAGMGMGPAGGAGGFSGNAMQQGPPSMTNRGGGYQSDDYMRDEHTIPNHIPSQKLTHDYLREYEDKMAQLSHEHNKDKYRKELISSLYDELQTPILIGVLFFLFQLPFINAFMFQNLGFLKIHNEDGNLNLYGLLFKSIMFGLAYFGFVRVTTYL